MSIFRHKYIGKLILLAMAVLAGMGSLYYTNYLVKKLKDQERRNMQLLAEAYAIINEADENQDINILATTVIENNNTVPVILTDERDTIIDIKNLNPAKLDHRGYVNKKLAGFKEKNKSIMINLGPGEYNLIYYDDSILLTMLIYYPYVQVGIIIMFILVSYLAFSSSKKAEQNQVWLSLSRETAHQLGTPTSSLAGWIEILQQNYPDLSINRELGLDVQRLEKVTERFSRIGSKPALSTENILRLISNTVEYLKSRTSSKVNFKFDECGREVNVPVNPALFEWVIENVSKNAIDAMEGKGQITYNVTDNDKHAIIDITDTGKGIPKSLIKKIFSPGFTTKQRGWGVGLSLAKRIIEEYHHGKIFVRSSEPGKGSVIRIVMRK